ncbi:MAG: transposase [Bacteroidales bacterium]|nr:transposase [Bacteroidales bacterium]
MNFAKITNGHTWVVYGEQWCCPKCGLVVDSPTDYEGCKCPNCGFQSERDKGKFLTGDLKKTTKEMPVEE